MRRLFSLLSATHFELVNNPVPWFYLFSKVKLDKLAILNIIFHFLIPQLRKTKASKDKKVRQNSSSSSGSSTEDSEESSSDSGTKIN